MAKAKKKAKTPPDKKVGRLVVEIVADVSGFTKTLDAVEARLRRLKAEAART
jgi:division protein CdvB (Snf7/Vps24/ESCRT-III family)